MISFNRVTKQYGRQVLFVDASFQLNPGDRAGLVGPNGSGKTTLFRMIVGEEHADDGDVAVPKKLSISHSRRDSKTTETMSGFSRSGRVRKRSCERSSSATWCQSGEDRFRYHPSGFRRIAWSAATSSWYAEGFRTPRGTRPTSPARRQAGGRAFRHSAGAAAAPAPKPFRAV